MPTARIFYNRDLAWNYTAAEDEVPAFGDLEYQLSASLYESADENTCEEIYRRYNRGSGKESPALDTFKMRSMSPGDVIVFGGPEPVGFICRSVGWRKVTSSTWLLCLLRAVPETDW